MKQKTVTRWTALLLTIILLFPTAAIAAHASADADVLVTIETDKTEYAALDTANVTVRVENKTDQTLTGVEVYAQAEHWLLACGSGSNALRIGDMNAGETRTYAFRCVLDRRTPGICWFTRLRLLFRQWIARPSAMEKKTTIDLDKFSAAATASVRHGSAPITITATAWYAPKQADSIIIDVRDALSPDSPLSCFWNPDANFYYINDTPWQRNIGLNMIYDWAAATMVMYYDTWRACFTYDDTEWMIQGWKGQYGFLYIGGEIGVYTRTPGEPANTPTQYNCADDDHRINMDMTLRYDAHDGSGYQKMFTLKERPHWWCNGFVDGHLADYKFNDRSCLIVETRLHLYDDEMVKACTAALEGCGFRRVGSKAEISTESPDTFAVDGTDVYLAWKNIDQGYKTR